MIDPTLERTFRGHKSYVTNVAFSPSLKHLASSSGDNCIMLWNYKPQLRAFRFIGHKVSLLVCVSKDFKVFVITIFFTQLHATLSYIALFIIAFLKLCIIYCAYISYIICCIGCSNVSTVLP